MGFLLGTNYGHDASACLFDESGCIVACCQERINRVKHSCYKPSEYDMIEYCLDTAQVRADQIDVVCLHNLYLPLHKVPKSSRSAGRHFIENWLKAHGMWHSAIGRAQQLRTISHHLAHAWCAVGTSGFDECLVVVIDGMGSCIADLTEPQCECLVSDGSTLSRERESVYLYSNGCLHPLAKHLAYPIGDSPLNPTLLKTCGGVGEFYEQVGRYLFGGYLQGGKVMGLSSYSQHRKRAHVFRQHRGLPVIHDGSFFDEFQRFMDWREEFDSATALASVAQTELTDMLTSLVKHFVDLSGQKHICLSGGVMLNGLATEEIKRAMGPSNVHVPPMCNDSGISVGCALAAYRDTNGSFDRIGSWTEYLGRKYEKNIVLDAIANESRVNVQGPYSSRAIARRLAKGNTLAWFQEGSEFGPRALGHRSILADPRENSMTAHINQHIKGREWFRPLAPVVTLENASLYFELEGDSSYMLRVVPVKEQWREVLGAVTHIDGTARVQTVAETENRKLHNLLREFALIAGHPILINTSLNTQGMPIVETPSQAIDTFLSVPIDWLVLDDLIVQKTRFDDLCPEYYVVELRQLEPFIWDKPNLCTGGVISHRVRLSGSSSDPFHLEFAHLHILAMADGKRTLAEILEGGSKHDTQLVKDLWTRGIINFRKKEHL